MITTSLEGKHALVCGASKGIGRATALAFAAQGAQVTALARGADDGLVAALQDAGAPGARALAVDLEDPSALGAAIDGLLADAGPVHILVNNAGGPAAGPLLEATPEAFLQAFRRHLFAAHLLVQRLLPGMREAGYGRVVNVISTSVREPIPNLGVSNTLRGAMASWAKTLSRELPPGVTINSILPGYTDTERLNALGASLAERRGGTVEDVKATWLASVPEGRLGKPEETAAAIAFLASPAAAYIRGVCLPVDGGRLNGI